MEQRHESGRQGSPRAQGALGVFPYYFFFLFFIAALCRLKHILFMHTHDTDDANVAPHTTILKDNSVLRALDLDFTSQ